MIQEYI